MSKGLVAPETPSGQILLCASYKGSEDKKQCFKSLVKELMITFSQRLLDILEISHNKNCTSAA